VNRTQVARGWARVYVYNNNPFKRVRGYRKAQRAAEAAGRGIWSLCD
jgi:endonuclease YncB( thermonuclease family)